MAATDRVQIVRPGQIARYLAYGRREAPPALATQLALVDGLYQEMLAHHGVAVGRRHARKHLAAALDAAAATVGAPEALLKYHRSRVLTADDPTVVRRHLADAFAVFDGTAARTQARRAA